MRISAIIIDQTMVLDGDPVGGVEWPESLYGDPIGSIHAVQSFNTHAEVEYSDPTRGNEIFRDDIHAYNEDVLAQLHTDTKAAQPQPPQVDPVLVSRLGKLRSAQDDYGKVEFDGHEYYASPSVYAELTLLRDVDDCYIIDIMLDVVEMTRQQRMALRELIAPQIKLMLNEYKKLIL